MMTSPSADTVPEWLTLRSRLSAQDAAFWKRAGSGDWTARNWAEVHMIVRRLAAHLASLGLRKGDRVVIMMPTSPEWEYCHLAVLSIGGVLVAIDSHDARENLRHILATTEPQALLLQSAEDLEYLAKLLPTPPRLIATLDAPTGENVVHLGTLLVQAPPTQEATVPVSPDDVATIIFTSGSTGQPKGIAYTHGQICLAGKAILARFPSVSEGARLACWLPLSNLFQRIIDLCAIMRGTQVYFVDSPREIAKFVPEIRPEFFVGVPRFYEKLFAGIMEEIAKQPWPKKKFIQFAIAIGEQYRKRGRMGKTPSPYLRMTFKLCDKLVLSRIRAVMGPNLKFMVSGSAPIPFWLLERMHGLGWLVLEAYGISECIVPVANNTLDNFRFGTVGTPLPENEIKFAEDGELLIRGPGLFNGYIGDASGREAFEPDGFFHTGDYANLDAEGFLTLTGRKSEIFKTSTGRRIAPVPIEAAIKQLDYVEFAVVLGRNRPVPIAILVLKPGTAETPIPPGFKATISADIETACSLVPPHQKPAGVIVTQRTLSIEGGELTSNLKLKRNAIEHKFEPHIEALYVALARSSNHSQCLVEEAQ